ncbi:MAG: hypothetical protein FWE03_05320 [Firmicutes bacterium]|nr:hypothetical protein [Bacillota bacterium]
MDDFYIKKSFACDCGITHSFDSILIDNITSIENIKPNGTRALFIGECDDLKKKLSKNFRLTTLSEGKNYEDIRLVIGHASGTNLAKYIAKMMRLECIIIGSGEYLSSCLIHQKNGGYKLIKTPPHYIIAEHSSNEIDIANSFAFAVLSILSIFEYFITKNQNVCPIIFNNALNVSKDLIHTVKKSYIRGSAALKEAVIDANLKLAIINGYLGNEFCLSLNGAVQGAAALSQYFIYQHGQKIDRIFSSALVLAPAVIKAYAAFLEKKIDHCPPPDNALRIEKLVDYFGIKEATAAKMMSPYLNRLDLEKQDYLIGLFRQDYLKLIKEIDSLINEALFLFFKLLPDGGFMYREYADSLEIGLCMGIGADLLKGETLLKIMRDKGVLDEVL